MNHHPDTNVFDSCGLKRIHHFTPQRLEFQAEVQFGSICISVPDHFGPIRNHQ